MTRDAQVQIIFVFDQTLSPEQYNGTVNRVSGSWARCGEEQSGGDLGGTIICWTSETKDPNNFWEIRQAALAAIEVVLGEPAGIVSCILRLNGILRVL